MGREDSGIFSDSRCFDGYVPTAIDPDTWSRLEAAYYTLRPNGQSHHARPLLLRFECYLQLTNQRFGLALLEGDPAEVRMIVLGFLGALYTPRFESGRPAPTIYGHARLFSRVIALAFGAEFKPAVSLPVSGVPSSDLASFAEMFERAQLPAERVSFWRGWIAADRNGKRCHYRFHYVHQRLGQAVSEQLFFVCNTYMSGRTINVIPCVNDLAQFIAEVSEMTPESFQDPGFIEDFIYQFCEHYFVKCHRQGTTIAHARVCWSAFLQFMQTAVLGYIWAEPYGPLPRPEVKPPMSHATHIRVRSGGECKTKLLTPIPLQLRDEEAKAAVFAQIDQEVEWVKRWAQAEVDAIWERHQRQLREAPKGVVSSIGARSVPSGLGWRTSRRNPNWLSHAAATFRSYGPAPDLPKSDLYALYPRPYPKTAWELGIPNQPLLMAFSALLVCRHPQITPAFLQTLEVYDAAGNERGVKREDGRTYLVGFKRRKGPRLAEQVIELGPDTAKAVEQLIELTAPFRVYLRQRDDPAWQKLFIVGALAKPPQPWRSALVDVHRPWLASRFEALLALPPAAASDLADRFALTRLRSSIAALEYLRSGSVQKMAMALGHTRWKPALLDRYLPKVLHEFFVERWIRIFQTGVIVEALKDSPYLHRASAFATMEELHLFLQNHALECPHSAREWSTVGDTAAPRVLIGLDVGILTMLLSIERAVESAIKPVASNARYWAKVAGLLCTHIEHDPVRTDFRAMLTLARQSASEQSVEHLIYV